MSDWADDLQVQEWLGRVRRELVPMVRDSAMSVSVVTVGGVDVKFAVELGLSILLEKPIILAVYPGAHVPDKLALIAEEIVEVRQGDMAGLVPAIERVRSRLAGQDVP